MEAFEEHFETIKRLYIDEGRTAKAVQEILERHYSFPKFKPKEFTKRLGRLDLRKKLKRADWILIEQELRTRGSGKRTGVYIEDVLIPWSKVSKEIRRAPTLARPRIMPEKVSRGRAIVRTPSPFPQRTISVASHDIRYPDTSEFKKLEDTMSLWMISKQARLQLDQALESAHLPWGQFEVLLSNLAFGKDGVSSLSPSNQFSILSTYLTGHISNQNGGQSFTKDSFIRLLRSNNQPRIRFSYDHLMDTPILGYLVGLNKSIFSQQATSPVENMQFLIQLMYQLANNTLQVYLKQDILKIIDAILDADRSSLLFNLMMIDHPITITAWSGLVGMSLEVRHKRFFRLLLELGARIPFLDSDTLYVSAYKPAILLGWDDLVSRHLQGHDGFKVCQDLLEMADPFESHDRGYFWSRNQIGYNPNEYIRYCVLHARPMHDNYDLIISEYVAWLFRFDSCEGMETGDHRNCSFNNDIDHINLIYREDHYQFITILICTGCCTWDYMTRVRVVQQVAKYCHWLYDMFVEYTNLKEDCPTIVGALNVLQNGRTTDFSTYIRSFNFLGQDFCQSFLQSLLLALIEKGRNGMITIEAIEAVLIAGANPNFHRSMHDKPLFWRILLEGRYKDIKDPQFEDRLVTSLIRHGAIINSKVFTPWLNAGALIALIRAILQDHRHHCHHLCATMAFLSAARSYDYEALRLFLDSGFDPNQVYLWQNSQTHEAAFTILGSAISILDVSKDPRSSGVKEMTKMVHFLLDLARPSQDQPVPTERLQSVLAAILSFRITRGMLEAYGIQFYPQDDLAVQKCEILEESGLDLALVLPSVDFGPSLATGISNVHQVVEKRESASARVEDKYNFFLKRGGRVTSDVLIWLMYASCDEHVILGAIEVFAAYEFDHPRQLPAILLQVAACQCSLKIVEKFVQLGVDVNIKPSSIKVFTALQQACIADSSSGPLNKVKFLVEQGADVNAFISGFTALGLACRYGSSHAIVEYLLEEGAAVDGYDQSEFNPLLYAINKGDGRVVWLLLEHGARVKDSPGGPPFRTPLRLAVDLRRSDITKMLLNKGAISQESEYEEAIQRAKERGHGGIARLIQEHVAEHGYGYVDLRRNK